MGGRGGGLECNGTLPLAPPRPKHARGHVGDDGKACNRGDGGRRINTRRKVQPTNKHKIGKKLGGQGQTVNALMLIMQFPQPTTTVEATRQVALGATQTMAHAIPFAASPSISKGFQT